METMSKKTTRQVRHHKGEAITLL